jgi:adenine-specific DNA-methyltransferase
MAKIKNKQELISKIKNAEGFSNEEKSQMLALLNENKTYGLVWENSTEDAWEMMKDYVPVLKEDVSKGIENGRENPNHILIEGDNLNALTALTYTHEGKIDVIYIDPPYNTGNKDFVYNDSYVDSEDSYRHSKWLSFMDKRLRLARRLLSDKGVIFISIDENELGQLKILGDEVFNSNNFVGQWNWFKAATPPALSKKIKRNIEYILSWQKGGNNEVFRGVQKVSSSNDPFTKPQNSFKILTFPSQSITCKFEDGLYPAGVYGTDKFPNEMLDDLIVENGKNKNAVRFRNRFIWVQTTLDSNIFKGLNIELSRRLVLSYKRNEYSPEVPPNFIDASVGVDTTENAGRHLAEIFDGIQPFDYPKPVSLIKYILNFPCHDDIAILDFFAGSGTTLHATMQLNAEDGGHRQCILVTNNENNICEEVTYERNKRVIEGYTKPNGEFVEGLKDNNLRYFKVGFTPREKTDENMFRLAKNCVNLLRIKHDVYKETQLGELENPYRRYRYFEEDGKQLLVILDTELIGDIVEQLEDMEVSKPIPTYVFATGAYPFTEDFESVADKVELYPLPHGIYQACERNMPKMIDKEIENPDGISLSNEELETSMEDLTKEEA